MMRTLRTLLAAAMLLVTAGAASAGGGGLCSGFTEGATIALRDSCFEGVAHFAATDRLTVRNEGRADHDYIAVDGTFDSGLLAPGEEATITAPPGVHRVYCTLHGNSSGAGMAGVLVVGDGVDVTAASESSTTALTADVAGPSSWLGAVALAGLVAAVVAAGLALGWRRRMAGTSDGTT